MAANTKQIKGDVDRKPSPQYYNPVADEYEYLYGENGASRHILYSSDGQPITSSGNKLAVRASEIETLLNDIKGKDFATQTTLAQILNKIIAAPATEAKQTALNALIGEVQAAPTANTMLARLKSLEDKIAAIIAGTSPAVTTLSGSIPTLKDYTDATVSAAFGWYLTGENRKKYTDVNFQPYDVSKYKTKYVYYQNNTDAERNINIYGFASSAIISGGISTATAVFSSTILTVAAGASLLMTPSTVPELGIPITGLAVRTGGTPMSVGAETIRIFGGVL